MRVRAGLIALVLVVLAAVMLTQRPPRESIQPEGRQPAGRQEGVQPGTGPEGYTLALSWSPSFCLGADPDGETGQCERGAQRGLVVHGLWPERSAGRSEYCETSEAGALPPDLAQRVTFYMPSLGLARHEWEKHGSCTGLGQRGYFDATERAWRRFKAPKLLVQPRATQEIQRNALLSALAAGNDGMALSAIALQCSKGGQLREIRLCLDASLSPRPCPRGTARSCPTTIRIPPPR